MIPAPNRMARFRFSTRGPPLRECAKSLSALHDRKLIDLRLEPLRDHAFHADFRLKALPELGIMAGILGGLRHLGPVHDDDLFMFMNLAGDSVASDGGNEVALHGNAICGRPGNIREGVSHIDNVHFIALRLPSRAISHLVTGGDVFAMRIVPRGSGALKLLKAYLSAVLKDDEVLEVPDLQRLFVTHVHDLAALALGATRDATFVAEGRGVRAARLQAIKDDIRANLGSELTVSATAARHHMTPRYLHRLFEEESVTYSQYVIAQRLARVHRMLTDPRFAASNISSLAYDAGFGDLSHFNRLFRQRYHATPSDVRHQRP